MSEQQRITVPPQQIRRQREHGYRHRRLYWAFGSNLSVDHMARRCPAARPYRRLYVRHLELTFRGVADVVTRRGAEAGGGLWWITPECERSLDAHEGVAAKIYLRRFLTVMIDDEPADVLFYQMRIAEGIMPPTELYLSTIERGYRDFRLDLAGLSDALNRSWDERHVTPYLRDRDIRRGQPRLAEPYPEFELTEDDLRQAGAL